MSKWFSMMILLCCPVFCVIAEEEDNINEYGNMEAIVQGVMDIGKILEKNGIVLDAEAVKTSVIDAMIRAIDPHAAILTREQVERRLDEQLGVFYGVGLTIRIKDKRPRILGIIEEGPSANSELQVGDIIETIDGHSTEGMALEEVVNLLRGNWDEAVELRVRGEGENKETRSITIIRDAVQTPKTGTMEQWPQQIGYVKVNGLYEGSGGQIVTQLKTWTDTNFFGVILDIRAANGMDLESADKIAGLFAKEGTPLFSIRDGHNAVLTSYEAKNETPLAMPVMLLVDKETRGSAEVLASVLKHRRGVMLIGEPTSGDDRIREAIPLPEGKMLYIATKRIDPCNGLSYRGKGVAPDVIVTESNVTEDIEQVEKKADFDFFSDVSEREKQERALASRTRGDPVLHRATDILLGIKALGIPVR